MRSALEVSESFRVFNDYSGNAEPMYIVKEEDVHTVADYLREQGYGVNVPDGNMALLADNDVKSYRLRTAQGEISLGISRFSDIIGEEGKFTGIVGIVCDIEAVDVPHNVIVRLRNRITELYDKRTKEL